MPGVRRGLAVLVVGAAVLIGSPAALGATQQQSLAQALSSGIQAAGGASAAYVVDLNTGAVLFSSGSQVGHLPASVEKLYTTSTALLRFGPNTTLTTQLLGSGSSTGGTWHGTLVLRGAGDPTGFRRCREGQHGHWGADPPRPRRHRQDRGHGADRLHRRLPRAPAHPGRRIGFRLKARHSRHRVWTVYLGGGRARWHCLRPRMADRERQRVPSPADLVRRAAAGGRTPRWRGQGSFGDSRECRHVAA